MSLHSFRSLYVRRESEISVEDDTVEQSPKLGQAKKAEEVALVRRQTLERKVSTVG